MRKRLMAMLIGLCVALTLMSTAAFAAGGEGTIYVGGVELTGSTANPVYATTDDSGAVKTDGASAAGHNIAWDGETLTLKNAKVAEGGHQGAAIYCANSFALQLVGDNTVTGPDISDSDNCGIYTNGSIAISGGKITVTSGVSSGKVYGIRAREDIQINDSEVIAVGAPESDSMTPEYGGAIFSETGNIAITGAGTVVEAYSGCGQKGLAALEAAAGNITIDDQANVKALAAVLTPYYEEGYMPAYTTADGGSFGNGIRAFGDIFVNGASVYALGCESNYSGGIFSESGSITIESGTVQAVAGRAVNHTDADAAGSAGISAGKGSVTINGGEVTALVTLSEQGIADGIRAYGEIKINGGTVTATGASVSLDGVEPQYSNGIFAENGDITITGDHTVVIANSGYASSGITGIGTDAGDIIIKGGTVRAHSAYPTGGYSNGFSALKGEDGTGGDIVISGGTFAAAGYTGGIHCEGDLIARPVNNAITMKVLDEVAFLTWELDWDKMDADASEIEGTPFTAETVIVRALTEDKQYFGGTSVDLDPIDPIEPADPSEPDDNNPQTGDHQEMTLWVLAVIVSGCAAVGILASHKQKRC